MATSVAVVSARTWVARGGASVSTSGTERHQSAVPCLFGPQGGTPCLRPLGVFLPRQRYHHLPSRSSSLSLREVRKGGIVAEATEKPSGGSGKFLTGFLIGGVVLGVLGFFFAPQISKTLLGENEDGSPRKLPRWLDEEDSLEATRRSLNEKIAQLNAAIDDVSAQLPGVRNEETADEELETSL